MKKIPKEDNSYDIIYCSEVFEHLLKEEPFISECKRVLVNNGYLVLTTDNPCGVKNIIRMIKQDSWFFHIEGHNQYYSPRDMKKLFEKNQFEVLFLKAIGRIIFSSLGDCYLIIGRNKK